MKTEELKELGLNEEQIQKVFALNGKDVNEVKKTLTEKEAEIKTLNDAKTAVENSLNETKTQLEALKGEDVEGIKQKLAEAQKALTDQQDAYAREKADREFDSKLNEIIGQKGGKNAKAIKALLKIDELKESKNQDADITSAIEALAKDENSNFLFSSKEPIKKPVAGTGGQPPKNEETKSLLNALKEHYKQ
nr:phage scaffolding protein [Clostridia bacterium]